MFPISSSSSTTSSSPSCYTTTTTTATSTSTVTTVAQSAIQAGSSSERRKCTQKRKHCGPTSGEGSSPAKKPCTSPRPGSPLPSTSSGYTFTPYEERDAPGPSRSTSLIPSKMGLRPDVQAAFNPLFMQRMQTDVYHAQENLELIDKIAASMFQEQCDEVPEKIPEHEPNVIVLRGENNPPMKLDWDKLTMALARLQKEDNQGGFGGEVGKPAAEKAVRFLQLLYRRKHLDRLEPRYTSPAMFTHLCAQALSTQCIRITPTTPYPLSGIRERFCFVSGEDLKTAINNPESILTRPAIGLLRHRWSHDTQRRSKRRWKKECDISAADYPLHE